MGGIIRFIKNSFGLQKMYTYEKRRELLTKKYQTLLQNNDFEDNGLE